MGVGSVEIVRVMNWEAQAQLGYSCHGGYRLWLGAVNVSMFSHEVWLRAAAGAHILRGSRADDQRGK